MNREFYQNFNRFGNRFNIIAYDASTKLIDYIIAIAIDYIDFSY